MPTKAQAQDAIKNIEDQGKNTAKEVRDALTLVMEYTETVPQPPDSTPQKFFQIEGTSNMADSSRQNKLQYSFRGIEGQFVNFTFNLFIANSNNDLNVYSFFIKPSPTALKSVMKDNKELNFALPIKFYLKGQNNLSTGIINSKITLSNGNTIVFDFLDVFQSEFKFERAQIISSICFHSSPFNMEILQ